MCPGKRPGFWTETAKSQDKSQGFFYTKILGYKSNRIQFLMADLSTSLTISLTKTLYSVNLLLIRELIQSKIMIIKLFQAKVFNYPGTHPIRKTNATVRLCCIIFRLICCITCCIIHRIIFRISILNNSPFPVRAFSLLHGSPYLNITAAGQTGSLIDLLTLPADLQPSGKDIIRSKFFRRKSFYSLNYYLLIIFFAEILEKTARADLRHLRSQLRCALHSMRGS